MKVSRSFLKAGVVLLTCLITLSQAESDFEINPCNSQTYNCAACPYILQEVCGDNGITYDNCCLASCAGANVVRSGSCPGGLRPDPIDLYCTCTWEYNPVCGPNGEIYPNPCVATKCQNVKVVGPPPCQQEELPEPVVDGSPTCTMCTKESDPQCGTDGTTYPNPCIAKCYGAFIAHAGECGTLEVEVIKPEDPEAVDCVCPMEYFPVCGEDNKLYFNYCEAQCRNVTIVDFGPCPPA